MPPRIKLMKNGADDGSRTRDLRLGKATLYQLSYVRMLDKKIWCGREDLNLHGVATTRT